MSDTETPSSTQSSQTNKKLALSLLVVCILALGIGLIGLINQANQKPTGKDGKPLASVLESSLHAEDHLLFLELSGPIEMESHHQGGGLIETESNAVTVRKALEDAQDDDSVKGVLLKINSPGGTVGMSQELNAAVSRVSAQKPVVAYFGDLAASGGYYTACAADKIVSNPGTLTGSIGVIISTMSFKELLGSKLGIKTYTIKSGQFKDLLSPYRDASAAELALVQRMIDESYQQFLNAVLTGRTRHIQDTKAKEALADKIRSIADGRVLVGTEAKRMGLVDELGDQAVAQELLDKMAKARFGISRKEPLPLEEGSEGAGLFSIIKLLGEGRSNLASTGGESKLDFSLDLSSMLGTRLPFSMSHPHEPLWILE